MPISSGLATEVGVGVIASIAGAALIVLGQWLARRVWDAPVRRFWRGFRPRAMIMTSEYEVRNPMVLDENEQSTEQIEFTREQDVAAAATSGYFMSYGMFESVSSLSEYLRDTLKSDVTIIGDKGRTEPRDDR